MRDLQEAIYRLVAKEVARTEPKRKENFLTKKDAEKLIKKYTKQYTLQEFLNATAGLGLGVYAGEDLPSNEDETATKPEKRKPKPVESLSQRIAKAKQFEVQYGGGKEKLVDVCKWEAQGDEQAKAFLDNWRTKSKGNEAAYNFIKDQGLQKESA